MSQSTSAIIEPSAPPAASRRLTWSLVICTFKREKVLPRCVRCAINSTRRPSEVIVVDASPYWDTTRDAILGEFEAANPDIKFVYAQARRASATSQRNQGIELTTADVAFTLDDDSLLFPDSAERIMEAFDADVNDDLVALTPVFASEVPDADVAPATPGLPTQGHVAVDEVRASVVRRVLRKLLWSHLQLLPYDGGGTEPNAIPEHLKRFGLIPAGFVPGSACLRTTAARQVRFEEILQRYAAGDDWDMSERIKALGVKAYCPASRQCHLEAPGGRLVREVVFTLRYCNFMVLHVLHSHDVARSRRLYRQMLWRRVVSEALADLGKLRWRMPRARGTWRALRLLPAIFGKTKEELKEWYPELQRQLIESSKKEDAAR